MEKGITAGSALFDKQGQQIFGCGILSRDAVGTNEITQFLHLFDVEETHMIRRMAFLLQFLCSLVSLTDS